MRNIEAINADIPKEVADLHQSLPEMNAMAAAMGWSETQKDAIVEHSIVAMSSSLYEGMASAFRMGALVGYLYAKQERI